MDAALWHDLAVEVGELLDEVEVGEQDRSARAQRERVERVVHGRAGICGDVRRVERLARAVLAGVHFGGSARGLLALRALVVRSWCSRACWRGGAGAKYLVARYSGFGGCWK